MPRCSTIRENLTAWADGELSGRWRQRVETHLERCPVCHQQASELHSVVRRHERVLRRAVAIDPVDAHRLLGGVRRALAAQDLAGIEPRISWVRRWILRPLPLAVAASLLLTITLTEVAGGPDDVLVPLGVKDPPAEVSKKPVMFRDYAIIEQLEVLENFDTVVVEPLDDTQIFERG